MTTRNEEILKAAHELEYPENVPYFVNGAEWADKHPSKESFSPKNRWKPSEEQMEMVDKIINALSKMQLFGGRNALIDLKHDLEKLREE